MKKHFWAQAYSQNRKKIEKCLNSASGSNPCRIRLRGFGFVKFNGKIIEMKTKTLTILLNVLLNHVSRVGSINRILLNLKMHTSLLYRTVNIFVNSLFIFSSIYK